MKDQRGFTLIETLVAGVISVIIPGVVIALLKVSNSELGDSSAKLRLNQISNAVSEDIQRSAFAADHVLQGPGMCAINPVPIPNEGVAFCDAAGATLKAYRILQNPGLPTGRLQERVLPGGWTDFTVGSDRVSVEFEPDTFGPKAPGLFGVGATAGPAGQPNKYVYFNFRYDMTVGGAVTTLAMQTESVICRN